MAALIDSNFLLATIFPNDENHAKALAATKNSEIRRAIILAPVLQEFFYIVTIRPLIERDFQRMLEIMEKYASAEFDYTDTAIMAVAERLNITDIYTFDRRDFQVFRPRHCDDLRLLP